MRRSVYIFIFALASLLVIQAVYSLQWPIAHDEAPLFYEAFLMRTEGRVPYRDIFDFQMPGSYLAYYFLGRLGGFNAFRIRLLDLTILGALIAITFNALRRFGKIPAFFAGVLFGLKYLQAGPLLALQREYLLLIPISLAVWIGLRDSLTNLHRFSLGLLFGLAALIKPHAALGLLPFLLFDLSNLSKQPNISAIKSLALAALGFALPFGLIALWLTWTNALIPFLTIAKNYWPLYAQINGAMEVHTGAERTLAILDQMWRLGDEAIWLIPAGLGVYFNRNKPAYLLTSLALCYAIYPAFSGQFFPYHYIPFTYFVILLASLALTNIDDSALSVGRKILPCAVLVIILALNVRLSQTVFRQMQRQPIASAPNRVQEITRFLERRAQTGDLVQPLDWTGGALAAMLATRTHLATPYVFDFYFYHHISTPYIQSIRADFMTRLQESRPRFMIEVTSIDKPWVSGPDTSRDFPELRKFIAENYALVVSKADYSIYEIK